MRWEHYTHFAGEETEKKGWLTCQVDTRSKREELGRETKSDSEPMVTYKGLREARQEQLKSQLVPRELGRGTRCRWW